MSVTAGEVQFDVFLTADKSLSHQQTLHTLAIGIVVLAAGSTKLEDLRALAPEISKAVAAVEAGTVVYVPAA